MLPDHDEAGDWVSDFEHENGRYQNRCSICHCLFIGHKRRIVCKSCDEKFRKDDLENGK